ncbi:MAG TPA: hypothetical protein VKQ30_17715 [Ktedonobacterales bacterium]|nr:hypothetical protein [Ktedonobacterales bacterium]
MRVPAAIVTFYSIHGVNVIARAATSELDVALADLLRPFAVDGADFARRHPPVDLTIRLATGPLPGAAPTGGTIWLEHGPLRSTVVEGARYLELEGHLVARYLPAARAIEASVPSEWGLSSWQVGHAIVFPLLVEALREHGLFSLHAAALSKNGRVVVFPAESGSGKTTLALTLLRAGFGLLSDDAPALRREGADVLVYGFPEPLNLTRQTSAFFPEVAAQWHEHVADERGKVPLDSAALYGGDAVASGKPGAVVFPTIGEDDRTTLAPLAKSTALLRLAALAMPAATQALVREQFDVLAVLVARTPCYTMRTGRDFAALPGIIERLLGSETDNTDVV